MKGVFRILLVALCIGVPATAQQPTSFVTPRGVISVQLGGSFTKFDSRFGGSADTLADGTRVALGAPFAGPLTAARFTALQPLQTDLNRFFAAETAGAQQPGLLAGADNLSLGTLDFGVSAEMTRAPLTLSVGMLPRLSVEVVIPFVQLGRSTTAFSLANGSVGRNPDAGFNRSLLARIGAGFGDLGGSPFLPLGDSPLGVELQQRVNAAAPGEELLLPTEALTTAELLELLQQPGFGPVLFDSRYDNWRLGDVEVGARMQLLNTVPVGAYPPTNGGSAVRAAAEVLVRLPTGQRPDSVPLPDWDAGLGQPGVSAGLVGDWFQSRLHATAMARYTLLLAGNVERHTGNIFAPAPGPRTLERDPGDELEVRLIPRFRLNPFLSLGLQYSFWSKSADRYSGNDGDVADLFGISARTAHSFGAGARFSTLPSYFGGGKVLPLEISLGYTRAVAGSGGAAAAGTAEVQVRVYQRAWGRRRPAPAAN